MALAKQVLEAPDSLSYVQAHEKMTRWSHYSHTYLHACEKTVHSVIARLAFLASKKKST